ASYETLKERGAKADILALLETHVSGNTASEVCNKFKFEQCVRIKVVGFAGGLWMLWNYDRLKLQIFSIHDCFIHSKVLFEKVTLHLITVYAPPSVQDRSKFWADLSVEIDGI
ncbi:hypothetical protein V2J09_008227, partial [Rumex salicifolius]